LGYNERSAVACALGFGVFMEAEGKGLIAVNYWFILLMVGPIFYLQILNLFVYAPFPGGCHSGHEAPPTSHSATITSKIYPTFHILLFK